MSTTYYPSEMTFEENLDLQLQYIKAMLLEKNRKYGNSALEPIRIFSKSSNTEQLQVRIDDKISRLRSQQSDDIEDTVDDLIGYLFLLKIAKSKK